MALITPLTTTSVRKFELVSRDQTSLYTKIDIFFPTHGKGDYVGPSSFHQTMYWTVTKTPD